MIDWAILCITHIKLKAFYFNYPFRFGIPARNLARTCGLSQAQSSEPEVLLWKGYLKVPTMHPPQMRPCILQPTEPKVLLWKGYLKVPTMHSPQMRPCILQPTEPKVLLWKGYLKVPTMHSP